MAHKNYDLALGAAREMAARHERGDHNRAHDLQQEDAIDGWVGRWEWDAARGKNRMVWPEEIVTITGVTSRRAKQGA